MATQIQSIDIAAQAITASKLDPNVSTGGGGKNYILNPSADTDTSGWATYDDGAALPVDGTGGSPVLTWTRTTSSPLRGTGSFLWTKDAANRLGNGVSYAFSIDPADQAKPLFISFDYLPDANYVDGSINIWIYDVTNGVLIQAAPYTLSKVLVIEKFAASFQSSPNSTSYRLILHNNTTSAVASTVKVDNFSVGPSYAVMGSPVTDWKAYTPTWSNIPVTSSLGFWRRVGDSMECNVLLTANGNASGQINVAIPAGYTIDFSKATSANVIQEVGTVKCSRTNAPTTPVGVCVLKSVTAREVEFMGPTTGNQWDNTYPGGAWVSGDIISAQFIVPIVGWGTTTVMSDNADTRVVAAQATFSSNSTGIASGSDVKVPFDTVNRDTHGKFSSSNNNYTIPVSGYYKISGNLYFGTTTNVGNVNAFLYVNGVSVSCQAQGKGGASSAAACCAYNFLRLFNAGDVIDIRVNQNLSVSELLRGDGNSPGITCINIERLSGPSQIAATESVQCRYKTAAGQSIPTTSFTTVDFETKDFDSHGAVTTGTGWKFTAPISGVYRVSSIVTWDNLSFTVGKDTELRLRKNGSDYAGLDIRVIDATQTFYRNVHGETLVNLLAGDYIHIVCYQNEGTRTLMTSAIFNWVTINRVGNY